MALEQASYISQLNAANPLSTDTVAQADDHLRLIKSVLKATFPNLNAPVTKTPAELNAPIPAGLICMWSGVSVPSGWALCDGTGGTPDLRGKFVLGASSEDPSGTSGGSWDTESAGNHLHTASAAGSHSHGGSTGGTALTYSQIPPHTHTLQSGGAVESGGEFSTTTGTGTAAGTAQAHTHSISSDGSHSHTISNAGAHTHTFTPPYYALAYIMKT
jgi:microcystin-dependent protein